MLEGLRSSQAHLDTKGKDVPYGQQPVPKEEIAQRAVRNGGACLGQPLQLSFCEAGTMSHDSPVAQEARPFKEIDVPTIHLRMQTLRELHLARYMQTSLQWTSQQQASTMACRAWERSTRLNWGKGVGSRLQHGSIQGGWQARVACRAGIWSFTLQSWHMLRQHSMCILYKFPPGDSVRVCCCSA